MASNTNKVVAEEGYNNSVINLFEMVRLFHYEMVQTHLKSKSNSWLINTGAHLDVMTDMIQHELHEREQQQNG